MDLNGLWVHLPFVLSAGGRPHFNIPRLIEAAVIAIVTAVVVNYTTQQVITAQVTELRSQVMEIKASMEQMRHDLYEPRVR